MLGFTDALSHQDGRSVFASAATHFGEGPTSWTAVAGFLPPGADEAVVLTLRPTRPVSRHADRL